MKLYAFIGKTGTGKSYNAQFVAKERDIHYIIDDAILIKDTKVIAGKSAKTASSKIASVKIAVFMNEDTKEEMVKAIKKEDPDKLLILGTSDDMVEKIAANLELGNIDEKIYIDQIATKEQIAEAIRSRNVEGKHVVPVPTFEIKKQFSGYFLDSLKIFGIFNSEEEKKQAKMMEKTIIRPTYSYLGKYTISDSVINSIVSYSIGKIDGVSKVFKVATQKYIDGIKLDIDIEVVYGKNIPHLSSLIQNTTIYVVDNATGINIFAININVKSIKR